MRILFIHHNIETTNNQHMVPGLASISAWLKKKGHTTSLIFLQEKPERDDFINQVAQVSPDLIGFSTLTNQWKLIRRHTQWIREALSVPIIHGGVHVTVAPEESIACPEIDMICVGEGEYACQELVERLGKGIAYDDVRNIWLKKPDGTVIKNPLHPLIQNLDNLPFPDRELFDYRRLLMKNPSQATLLMAGRGCPFACKYCVNHVLHNRYKGLGKYTRMRSVPHVLSEIKYLRDEYGIQKILIYDDTFTYDRQWLETFCGQYPKELDIPFSVNIRLDSVNAKILTMMHDAGCYRVIAGIESGSERLRREVLGRRMSNQQILDVFKTINQLGMETITYNMIGLPTETAAEVEETIELNRVIQPNYSQMTVFYPFPGTDLYSYCKEKGHLTEREENHFFTNQSTLDGLLLSQEQIGQYVSGFQKTVMKPSCEATEQGIYDFLYRFSEATVVTENEQYVACVWDDSFWEGYSFIQAHPESEISFCLDFPQQSQLVFGICLAAEVWEQKHGIGVLFKIVLVDDKTEETVFARYIDPKNIERDRRWYNHRISLSMPRPGKRTIRFITTTKSRLNYFCAARWSHPVLYPIRETSPKDEHKAGK